MANGVTLNATMEYADSTGSDESIQVSALFASISNTQFIRHKQLIGTSQEAIVLGDVTTPGWAMFVNRDTTNFITLLVASSGAVFAKLKPGEFALLRLGSGAQVPYALADTAACLMEYLISIT